jgi:hypothetical protein
LTERRHVPLAALMARIIGTYTIRSVTPDTAQDTSLRSGTA